MTTTVESLYQCQDGVFGGGASIIKSGDFNSFHGCAAFCTDTADCHAFQFTNVYDDSVEHPETCKLAAEGGHGATGGVNEGQFKVCIYGPAETDGS